MQQLKFLECNVRLMRQHIRDDGHKTFPVIVNICIYNGQERYDGPANLLDMCDNPDWVRKYMFQSFQLVDLNRESTDHILQDKKAAFAELLLRQGSRRKFYSWLKTHEKIFLNLLETGHIPYVEEALHSILQLDTDEQVEAKLATINPVLKELAMSAAQRLRQEGKKLGPLKGRQESSMRIAQAMFQEHESIEKIIRYMGLSKEEIQKIKL